MSAMMLQYLHEILEPASSVTKQMATICMIVDLNEDIFKCIIYSTTFTGEFVLSTGYPSVPEVHFHV